MENKEKQGFKKGYESIPKKDMTKIRQEIMEGLKINNTVSFYQRVNGVVELKRSEAEIVEEIFGNYGITDIWGE